MKFDRNGFVRCRVCGCTEVEACDPPCSWVDHDLCSGCSAAAIALVAWAEGARRANRTALWREVRHILEASPEIVTDAQLLDSLEHFINREGAIVLHTGGADCGKHSGLGLRPGAVNRTLRQALVALMARPSARSATVRAAGYTKRRVRTERKAG